MLNEANTQSKSVSAKKRFFEPQNRLLILSAPRTGSTALTRLLSRAGLGHDADEFFHPLKVLEQGIEAGNALIYIRKVALQKGTDDGWFTCKMHFNQFRNVFKPSDPLGDQFLGYFNHFILTRRNDRVGQAISELFALQDMVWNVKADSDAAMNGIPYSRERLGEVASILARQITEEDGWRKIMAQHKLNVLEVISEELFAEPSRVLTQVCAHLGVPLPEDRTLPTRKISDPKAMEDFREGLLRDLLRR